MKNDSLEAIAIKFKLRTKILFGYGIILCLLVVVLAWAFVNLLELGNASAAILRENYKSILAAENMIDSIERQDSASLLMILGYKAGGSGQFGENEIRFSEWLGRAKDNITIEGEVEILSGIEKGYSDYLSSVVALEKMEDLGLEERKAFYHERVLPTFLEVRGSCVKLREINQDTMYGASERARRLSRRAIVSMGTIGVTTIAAGIFFSLFLSNLLVKPLREMISATKKVSEGNYAVEITTRSSDELGIVINEFNEMVKKLRQFHDLNIRKIIEEKSKSEAIVREIDDGIVVVDSDLKITNINPVASGILNVDINKATGRHFLESVKSEELFNHLKATVECGESPAFGENGNLLTVKREDRVSHYLFSITPVSSGIGNLQGVVLLLRDITKLKELDRMKSDFISTASHELRTPLTTIEMSVGLLMEKEYGNLGEQGKELLTAAQEELARLKSLINDLLDLSRIESGKVSMQMEPVSASELIGRTVHIMKRQADDRSIELSSEAEEALPAAKADANKITWVITNLVSNALRYTESGGHIKLSAEQSGSQIHISVADDGAGIPSEYQSRIFEKFVRVEGDNRPGGAGLGLAICREIIRAHGGTIWLESTPGRGSAFTFSLPVAV